MSLRGSKAAQLTLVQFPVHTNTADHHYEIQKLFLGYMKANSLLSMSHISFIPLQTKQRQYS